MSNADVPKDLARVTESEQDEILRLHTEEDLTVRQIALRLQRSPATISRHLKRRGVDVYRAQTAEATQVRLQRINARRLEFAEKLLDDAEIMRERSLAPYEMVVSGAEGSEIVQLPEPPAECVRAFSQSIRGHLSAVHEVTENINDTGELAAKSLLGNMLDGLTKLLEADPDAGKSALDQD